MNKPHVVGIAGCSGSGKTAFIEALLTHFTKSEITWLSQDDYYLPLPQGTTPEQNKLYNFDLPEAFDNEQFEKDIYSLLSYNAILKQEYTFNNPNILPQIREVHPAPILLIEGLFIFHLPNISNIIDLKIFIDADENISLERRMDRDLTERGYANDDVLYKWLHQVIPSYNRYLLPYKHTCDRVIINNSSHIQELHKHAEMVATDIKRLTSGN